jgi:predicted O-methyltransferase YrrM
MDKNYRINKIKEVQTAWTEHMHFAEWIVEQKNPDVIVDLGVEWGYSTYCFALAEKGIIYAIDSFEGDDHSGVKNTFNYVNLRIKQLKYDNIIVIKDYFDNVAKTWNKPIDILHIDGYHTYEAVKNDYETWSPFVKDDGVILFHDTCCYHYTFGVHKLLKEIDLPKTNFTKSCGLGIVSKDQSIIDKIKQHFYSELDSNYI